jgi:phosphonate transport system substrate-binding protein
MNLVYRVIVYWVLNLICCQIAFAQNNFLTAPFSTVVQWWQADNNKSDNLYQPRFSKKSPFAEKIYVVGIHPLHNPKRLFEVYAPLIDLFNKAIPQATFILEASRNYEEFDKKLYAGHFDFAMPNPYQTINALQHGYHVFAKMGDDYNFRGIILIRKDSKIEKISDLKGQSLAYPAPTALAATLMPQYYLHSNGLDINKDVENRYVGSQESAIMNVLKGNVAAGVTWPIPWQTFQQKNPQLAEKLELKWQTEPLVNNSWVVKGDISPDMTKQVRDVLLNLNRTKEGRAILATIPISTFEAANDETYAPVKAFIKKFNTQVRQLD